MYIELTDAPPRMGIIAVSLSKNMRLPADLARVYLVNTNFESGSLRPSSILIDFEICKISI
jgi:hypothetical protein